MQSARDLRGVEAAENQQGKKNFHPKVDDEARRLSKKKISVYKLMRLPLIYMDESGFAENMPRMFGYASAGMRCVGKYDVMSKRRTHVIGALTGDGLLTVDLFDCSINADVFEVWTEQVLLPVLPKRSGRCHGQCLIPYI